MMYQIKDWQDLTIQDDYMFKLIMSRKRTQILELKLCKAPSDAVGASFPSRGRHATLCFKLANNADKQVRRTVYLCRP